MSRAEVIEKLEANAFVLRGIKQWAHLTRSHHHDMRQSDAHFRAFVSTNDNFRAYLEGALAALWIEVEEDTLSEIKHVLEAKYG